jgi:hypothetical protein
VDKDLSAALARRDVIRIVARVIREGLTATASAILADHSRIIHLINKSVVIIIIINLFMLIVLSTSCLTVMIFLMNSLNKN